MTLFIASLFLPQTLGFVKPEDKEASDAEIGKQKHLSGFPNLLQSFASRVSSNLPTRNDTPVLSQTPPMTPPHTSIRSPNADFFSAGRSAQDEGMNLLSAQLAKVNMDQIAVSKRTLTIPQSRASSPPPATLVVPRPQYMRTASMTRPPTEYVAGEGKKKDSISRRRSQAFVNPAYSNAQYLTFDQLKGNGGLRNAVNAALQSGKIEQPLWVGLPGIPGDEIAASTKLRIEKDFESRLTSLVVDVSDDTARQGYDHYCKRMLWPIFHYQIPDSPKSKIYEEQSYRFYEQLNQAFADRICAHYKRGDRVWINDYHLLLVPKMVREKFPQAMIGLSLHIAFPSSEVFRCLEKRKQLLEGMLASNVISFQTDDHCQHFKQTCSRLLYVETTDCGIQLEHSFVNIIALPIGIDPKQLSQDIASLNIRQLAKELDSRYRQNGIRVIIGRDKLDHVKGVLHKIRAFGEFLRLNPDQQGRVVLLQFGSPAKTEPALTAEIHDLVTKINSRYSIIATDYQPIMLKADVSYQEYLALLTMADVFIVSSVREGMNLTCHEYVFCQQEKKNPLILSEFVGSAMLFEKEALMVNPFDYKQTAGAIQQALTMSEAEKNRRWSALDKIVHEEDGGRWAATFIKQIEHKFSEQQRKRSIDLPRLNPESFDVRFSQARRRLLFIDYEGTLLQWEPNMKIMAGTGKIVDLLNQLCACEENIVYVTSERTPSELERTFRRVQRLGLVAENGGYVRNPNDGNWENLTDDSSLTWKDSVRDIVQYYQERTPGTFIEEQNNRILFHYASAEDQATAQRQVAEMNNHINDSAAAQDAHALPMKNALVIEPLSITKATAIQHVFDRIDAKDELDFLACFGNDRSDEEAYAWVNTLSARGLIPQEVVTLTVNVGVRNTEAKAFVQSTFGVTAALERWARASNRSTIA